MANLINQHPSLILNSDIQDICNPLKQLNINYFCHVLVTHDNQFSAIGTSAGFTEHYLKNKYYNVDIHMAKSNNLNKFVIWDMIERRGLSAKMHSEAAAFGVKHTFTIIENAPDGRHCYHFANSGDSLAINQVYLSNLDLLKAFIHYFNEKINASKELVKAHQLKFEIESNAVGYQTSSDIHLISDYDREEYLKLISNMSQSPVNKNITLLNKTTNQLIELTPQQSKCIHLLATGKTSKEMAIILGLSFRTIEHYLDRIRHLLNCRSSKELINLYHTFNQD